MLKGYFLKSCYTSRQGINDNGKILLDESNHPRQSLCTNSPQMNWTRVKSDKSGTVNGSLSMKDRFEGSIKLLKRKTYIA